jgi:hypothetical protein
MKVDGYYPHTSHAGHPGVEYVLSDTHQPCFVCHEPTRCIDIDFEAPVCSTGCLKQAIRGYFQALAS